MNEKFFLLSVLGPSQQNETIAVGDGAQTENFAREKACPAGGDITQNGDSISGHRKMKNAGHRQPQNGDSIGAGQDTETAEADANKKSLYIDIEKYNEKTDDCSRPVDGCGYLLDERDAESTFAEIQNDVKCKNCELVDWKKGNVTYTVFIWLECEEENEEWNLGVFTNLKPAKRLMDYVIKKYGK